MAGAVLLWSGRSLLVFGPGNPVPIATALLEEETALRHLIAATAPEIPATLLAALRSLPRAQVEVEPPVLAERLAALGFAVGAGLGTELRRARERVPRSDPAEHRNLALAAARGRLARLLSLPAETLVAIAREEERIERSLGQERNAAEQFLAPEGTPLAAHAARWQEFRREFERQHARIESELAELARNLAPALSRVVGAKVAARLIAAAGGIEALGRAPAARLQLLGARRRPARGHGPRYGVLYRADRMGDVPMERRAAYARSLAALAVIAARADARATPTPGIAERLLARRDRRIESLRQRSR